MTDDATHSLRDARIDAYRALATDASAVLSGFHLTHSPPDRWTARIETVSISNNRKISATFENVHDLKIDWPGWSTIRLGFLRVEDVDARGLEDLNYHVQDYERVISFWCQEFEARQV